MRALCHRPRPDVMNSSALTPDRFNSLSTGSTPGSALRSIQSPANSTRTTPSAAGRTSSRGGEGGGPGLLTVSIEAQPAPKFQSCLAGSARTCPARLPDGACRIRLASPPRLRIIHA